jgi:hypothetical protein
VDVPCGAVHEFVKVGQPQEVDLFKDGSGGREAVLNKHSRGQTTEPADFPAVQTREHDGC